MDQLWAPWRMEYILEKKTSGCIFCDRVSAGDDEERLVLHRREHALVMMNRFPYTNGHLLIAPFRHTAETAELSAPEMLELFDLVRVCIGILRDDLSPDGFNVGMNLGKTAGAGVVDHLHLHVVPRWNGDTSFMSVVDDVRVIPEALRTTWGRLRKKFEL